MFRLVKERKQYVILFCIVLALGTAVACGASPARTPSAQDNIDADAAAAADAAASAADGTGNEVNCTGTAEQQNICRRIALEPLA